MTTELTMQLPVIRWTPKLGLKREPVKVVRKLEEMSLSELLFVALGSAQ